MKEFIWPLTLIAVSVIWALAWVTNTRIQFEPPVNEEEDE